MLPCDWVLLILRRISSLLMLIHCSFSFSFAIEFLGVSISLWTNEIKRASIRMCSQSVSGSSLQSGYNEDDVRERSGRSRREFEEIDAVLYDEEKTKRTAIKKICEEWSSKPHFRVRGRLHRIDRQPDFNFPASFRPSEIAVAESTTSSSMDLLTHTGKVSSLTSNELNVSLRLYFFPRVQHVNEQTVHALLYSWTGWQLMWVLHKTSVAEALAWRRFSHKKKWEGCIFPQAQLETIPPVWWTFSLEREKYGSLFPAVRFRK